ncbi:S-layer homology domain-containing protein [Paenibacillus thalictri]|nr:S-layer homology domain-containing protein [Paenibacillus thalictri]
MLKKAGTVALASAILLTGAPQVWADEVAATSASASVSASVLPGKGSENVADAKISKDQALELAKKYVYIPEGYVLNSINLNSYGYPYGQSSLSWSLNFSKKVKEQFYGNISMTINANNGRLTSYYINENDPEFKPTYPPKTDFKGAKQIAAAWLDKMNPQEQNQLQYNDRNEKSFRTPLDGNYQYSIRYDRTVDGVLYPQNGVSINVNGAGQIISYNYNWDDSATFEKNVKPMTLEQAAQAFRDKVKVSLNYEIPYQAKGDKKPIVSYRMDSFMLDAATGEPWNPGGVPAQGSDNTQPLTDKPLAAKPEATLNLTKEEAIAKVTSTFKLPDNAKLQDASYNEYTNPDTGETSSSWNLSWVKTAGGSAADLKMPSYNAWATVDSKTGEVKNFYMNPPYMPQSEMKDVEAKVSQDEAKAQAVELIKNLLPAYTDQLVLDVTAEKDIQPAQLKKMKNWDISFNRVIDGVNASSESVHVSIDRETGEIANYSNSISTFKYPQQKPQIISLDKAKELLFSQYDIQLNYEQDMSNNPMYSEKYKLMVAAGEIRPGEEPNASEEKKPAKLIYSLVNKNVLQPAVLDAETGTWKNASTGETVILEQVKADDIEGHWAQTELQLMLDYQALDVKDGKVNPNESITRGEMIKMLVIAMNGGNVGIQYGAERAGSFADVSSSSKYFAYVENAVDRGLLSPGSDFRPEAKMNREEMAELIVKALGLKGLTKYDSVFNGNIADKAKLKNLGEAAIVVGLDIMSLTNGSFNPEQEVTKAQAATAFFRYLQKRAEIQDRQYRPYY